MIPSRRQSLRAASGVNRTTARILFPALLLAGCTDNVVFQEDAQTPSGNWERGWNPTFAFDVKDTLSAVSTCG